MQDVFDPFPKKQWLKSFDCGIGKNLKDRHFKISRKQNEEKAIVFWRTCGSLIESIYKNLLYIKGESKYD